MNLSDGNYKISGDLYLGNLTNPVVVSAGSGAMTTTNKPNGSIHCRTDDDQPVEVLHNSSVEQFGFAQHSVECRLDDLTANAATTYTTYMPRDAIITGVSRRFTTAPSSAAGTVVTGITVDGNQILQSASETEEGVSNDTLTAHTLTGTAANLKVDKGDKVVVTVTSNNADMTGGTDPMFYIYYRDN